MNNTHFFSQRRKATVDLRKLEHVMLLAKTRHFARAAELAHLTQSALSRSIQSLEHSLGVPLFDRGVGGVCLTTAGKHLLERSKPLLQAAADLTHDMQLFRHAQAGQLSVGAGPFPSATLIPSALKSLQESHPGLSVTVHVDHAGALSQLLEEDLIELFVADISTYTLPASFEAQLLTTQHGGLFCRAGHPLLNKPTLCIEDFAGARLASVHLPAEFRERIRRELEPTCTMTWALVCDNIFLIKQMALSSDLILLCTHESLLDEITTGELVPLPLGMTQEWLVTISLVRRKNRTSSPAAILMQAALERAC